MGTPEIVKRLTDLGITLRTYGDDLLLVPGSGVPPDLATMVRDRKAELMTYLSQQSESPPADPSTGELLAWASELAEQDLVIREPISYVEVPLRTVTTSRVSYQASHYLHTIASARLYQERGSWGAWTSDWWRQREEEAVQALSALRAAVSEAERADGVRERGS